MACMDDEKLLTYKDLEKRFGVTRQTVWNWVRGGLLKAVKPSPGTVRFRLSDVREMEKEKEVSREVVQVVE